MSPQQHRIASYLQSQGYIQRYYGMSGLGQDDGPSTQQVTGAIVGDARGVAVAANSNLPITTRIGGGLMAAGGTIALIPGGQIPGAIVAAVGALTDLIGGLFKPDVTKIEATQIVNQIESQYLKPNLLAWQALPPNQKTQSVQAASLALVDHALAQVQQGCSNPALGTAGQRCISERLVKGGTAPWCPTSTGCDWITLYRDPIANDPNVIPDPPAASPGTAITAAGTVSGAIDSTVSSVSQALGGISPLYIGLGIIALAFLVTD